MSDWTVREKTNNKSLRKDYCASYFEKISFADGKMTGMVNFGSVN